MSIERIGVAARYSDAVIHNNTVYLAGHVPESSKGQGITEQTRDVLAQLWVHQEQLHAKNLRMRDELLATLTSRRGARTGKP